MNSPVTRSLFYGLILVIAVTALPLFAQQTQTAEEPKVREEMVVTARKVEESAQEVPISVAAPSESQLRDRGAETLEDVAANVAGFTVQNAGPGQSQVGMRGISAGRIIRDQPGVKEQVGVYLDESVISLSLFTPDIDLFDMSRIEVLRGPQGTLFGSGSLAGTVRYISNTPKLGIDESVAELSLSSMTDGGVGGSAKYAGNIPIGDRAAMRAVAYYTQYGGYIDAVQPGLGIDEDVNTGHRAGARVAVRFQPNDRLTITPRLLYQEVDFDGWNRIDVYNILANPFTTTRPAVQLGERRIFIQLDEPVTDDFLLGDLNLEYDFGPARLTSVTSFTDRDILVIRDAGSLTASITGGSFGAPESVYTIDAPLFDATEAQGFTQEVRLSASRPRLNWVTGIFYSDSTRDYGQNLPVIGFEDRCRIVNCGPLSGLSTAGTKLANKDELFKSDLHYDYTQLAIFGEANFAVTDRLELTGGLRYYDFSEDRDQVFDGLFADPIDSTGSVDADGFAPRVIVSYKLTDATRVNAQISKGFRLGGINDPLNLPLCTPGDLAIYGGRGNWEDETLWNYEVGAKSTIMGGRGTFNAAAYYTDIEDLQATVTAGSCSSRIILSVPSARSTGIEAEFELAPNDNFDFAISGNYNNSELSSSFTVPNAAGVPVVIAGIREGNRLPSVPEFQAAAAATYRWRMRQGLAGYLTGVYQHVGSRYTQIGDQEAGFGTVDLTSFSGQIGGPFTQNTFRFNPELPAYDLLNLRVGFLRGNWDTALFINNVTDERAFLALDIERGSRARVSYMTNTPRTFGVSTRVNF
ncbi:MAG TPA: TonB-dependent receptor [Thermoanaerobaculia bacterium]|nr:TonB-dependent receptor [Thermoanaerobaculia bacterium]